MQKHIQNLISRLKVNSPFFPMEPLSPVMLTSVPGPNAQKLLQQQSQINQDFRTIKTYIDFNKSRGVYLVDVDGNIILDMLSHISSQALGYNNPDFLARIASLKDRITLSEIPDYAFPPVELSQLLKKTLIKRAPRGMNEVVVVSDSGTEANEMAIQDALAQHQTAQRLDVLSFGRSFHGRWIAMLTLSHSKGIHSVDIPALDWPHAQFPKIKHPYSYYEAHNKNQEAQTLDQLEQLIKKWPHKIGAAIIEPVQGEGGDSWASPNFFEALYQILKKNEIQVIVDEVQSCYGMSGYPWAHDIWPSNVQPDYVTFSKRTILAGYYYNKNRNNGVQIRPRGVVDPVRILQSEATFYVIDADNLIFNAKSSGAYLLNANRQLENEFPGLVSNSRGMGCLQAIDFVNSKAAAKFCELMLQNGVMLIMSGDSAVRFRPAHIFKENHVDIYQEKARFVLNLMSSPSYKLSLGF